MEIKNKIRVKLTHNNDAFEDPKIKKLYFKFGFEGYGLYWQTLMILLKEEENKMERGNKKSRNFIGKFLL